MRFLAAMLFLLSAAGSRGSTPLRMCEADEATMSFLDRWSLTHNDATLGFDARIAPLWQAIEAAPENVFLHHAYQRVFLNYIESVRFGGADAAYKKLLAANPDKVAVRYAYARLLWGRRTAEAKRILEEVIAADPAFPWPHLALARVYQNKKFEDQPKQRESVEKFFALCPTPLASEAYESLRGMPPAFRSRIAETLRTRLAMTPSTLGLRVLSPLWQMEFQDPARDKTLLRGDLERLRAGASGSLPLLRVALEGYRLIEDRDGARWARERIAALAPRSFLACDIAIERWYEDRRRPTLEASRERVHGYYRELLEASDQWIQMCPLYEGTWSARFQAVRELPDVATEMLLATGEGLLRASAANSSNWFVAPSILVGTVFAERGIGTQKMAGLIERNRTDTTVRLDADTELDWFPDSWKADNEAEANQSYMRARLLRVQTLLREKKAEDAARELTLAERAVAAGKGEKAMWAMTPTLLALYLELGEMAKAEEVLQRLRAWLANQAPAEGREAFLQIRDKESIVWEFTARIAEREKRGKDAAAAFGKVLSLRTNWETMAERFRMIEKAGGRWEAPGREMAGKWDQIERPLEGFALTDTTGRKWTVENLRGKVTLVNIWATWCGPCVAELPYVQRIAEAAKDRKDVQVITLNIDENPALIAPFLRERGVTGLTVIPAQQYVEHTLRVNGFPRTWIVDRDGVARREQAGFTVEPEKWVERVLEILR